jgi:hypothetical protein
VGVGVDDAVGDELGDEQEDILRAHGRQLAVEASGNLVARAGRCSAAAWENEEPLRFGPPREPRRGHDAILIQGGCLLQLLD